MITSMSQAWDGSILLTGSSQRVMRLRPETGAWTAYSRVPGRMSGAMLDKLGRMWVFTDRGLYRTAGQDTRLERIDGEIPRGQNDQMRAVVITGVSAGAGEDEAWVTTYSGLLHYQQGRRRWLREADGLRTKVLGPPSLDPAGRLWVGHRDAGGASRVEYRGGAYQVVNIEGARGVTNDLMYSFHFPVSGGVWALTSSGVQILKAGRWVRLDRSDGLLWDECSQGAFLRAADGSYWIGTSRGVSRFAPRIEPEPSEPPGATVGEVRWGRLRSSPNGERHLMWTGGPFRSDSASSNTATRRGTVSGTEWMAGSGWRHRIAA
jgi:ligand-binding sensor domain-containing protein